MNIIEQKLGQFKNNGVYTILAFDHRGSFKKMMQKAVPTPIDLSVSATYEVTDTDATDLKRGIIKALAPFVSGILIDQDYGLPAYQSLALNVPFILPTEKTGYTDEAGERITELMYSGASIAKEGAQAMKILMYANDTVPTWQKQLQTSAQALGDAHANNLPLFLEFVLYSTDSHPTEDINKTLQSAIENGIVPDVWKIPYPGSAEASAKTTEIVGTVPWVLLTGGSSFDEFIEQYKIAQANGASGFVAGRALWQEACDIWNKPEELDIFLNQTLIERFKRLSA